MRTRNAATAAVVAIAAAVLSLPVASAQPEDPAAEPTTAAPAPGQDQLLHNVVYRARADGTSRGAVVAYKMDDQNVNSAQPSLLPGQTFEINAVLDDPAKAGMELSIEWPYGSNLHCEILVDDKIVAKADQFIAPRLFRPKDDPLYGVLQCGAPLNLPLDGATPSDTPVPPPGEPADQPAGEPAGQQTPQA